MERELNVAIEAAKAAGVAVRRWYDTQDFTTVEKQGDKGPLTEADLEADQILIDAIRVGRAIGRINRLGSSS